MPTICLLWGSYWETIEAGEIWEEEVVNQRKSGELYHAHQTIAPILGTDDTVAGFVAIQTEITERKEHEQQLQVMDRVLRHNLRNTMTVIQGRADTITAIGDEEVATHAEKILTKSEEILSTTGNQRLITSILSERPTVEERDLSALVRQITTSVDETYPEATISVDCPDDVGAATTPRIDRALTELLTNAVEHNDQATPAISVEVLPDGDTVCLEIADNGPTIPTMERQVMMGSDQLEPLYHGSGLGLWLVYWIVTRSNGGISFERNEPRGNIVRIELPRTVPDGISLVG